MPQNYRLFVFLAFITSVGYSQLKSPKDFWYRYLKVLYKGMFDEFRYWSEVVNNNTNMSDLRGDTHKATYEFSIPPLEYMKDLKIPVMVTYGNKDWSAPFNDYMRAEMIRQHKNNFTFRPYINTEHNFFPVDANNKPDTRYFNWDNVAYDWLKWLERTKQSTSKN